MYVPNAGHNLAQKNALGIADPSQALGTLGAFARHQIHGTAMPKLSWKHDDHDGKPRLTVHADPMPRKARLWVADADKRDFRKSTWKEHPATIGKDSIVGTIEAPNGNYRVFYCELEYSLDGLTYYLSTQVRVIEKK
jgi:PhoPQ-activated pathogenicity-related protein